MDLLLLHKLVNVESGIAKGQNFHENSKIDFNVKKLPSSNFNHIEVSKYQLE